MTPDAVVLAVEEARGWDRLVSGVVAVAAGWYIWRNPDFWRRGPVADVFGYGQRRHGRPGSSRHERPLRALSRPDSSWLLAHRAVTRGSAVALALAGVLAVITAIAEL